MYIVPGSRVGIGWIVQNNIALLETARAPGLGPRPPLRRAHIARTRPQARTSGSAASGRASSASLPLVAMARFGSINVTCRHTPLPVNSMHCTVCAIKDTSRSFRVWGSDGKSQRARRMDQRPYAHQSTKTKEAAAPELICTASPCRTEYREDAVGITCRRSSRSATLLCGKTQAHAHVIRNTAFVRWLGSSARNVHSASKK